MGSLIVTMSPSGRGEDSDVGVGVGQAVSDGSDTWGVIVGDGLWTMLGVAVAAVDGEGIDSAEQDTNTSPAQARTQAQIRAELGWARMLPLPSVSSRS